MKNTTVVIAGLTLLALSGCPKPVVELSSINVLPDDARLARGETLQFVASALYTDGAVKDVTGEALWSVDDAFVGTADAETPGLVRALGVGETVVRVRFGGKTSMRALTVVAAELRELQIDPPHPVVPAGLGVELRVTALRSDGSKQDVTGEAVWTSSSPTLATFEDGFVMGHTPGTLTFTASVRGLTVSVPVDVTNATVQTIDVQPAAFTLPVNASKALSATALMSDGSAVEVTRLCTWASSAPAIASTSQLHGELGLVTGRSAGKARITAAVLGKTGGSEAAVTAAQLAAIELSPALTTLAVNTEQQFTATGVFTDGTTLDLTGQVSWGTSQASVFTVEGGLVQALAQGRALLTAVFGEVRASREVSVSGAALTALQLEPLPAVVARGLTLDLRAVGIFSDGSHQDLTRQVIWRSADVAKATVSNAWASAGRVTGRSEGTTEVTATRGTITARTNLTVSAAQLVALQVTPTNPSLAAGQVQPFTAIGLFSDGTTQDLTGQATWSSSAPAVVAVSSFGTSRGLARALTRGTAEVRAALGSLAGSTSVTVTDAVLEALELFPAEATLPAGVAARYSATGRYSNGTTADLTTQVTWSSAAPAVVTMSNAPGTEGEARAVMPGEAQLSARLGDITGTAHVTVTAATVTGLELSPSNATLAAGLSRDFTATATYSDGTSRPMTAQTSFSVVDPAVAAVSTDAQGAHVVGLAVGSTKLVATLNGFRAEASLTITPAQLASLSLDPPALTLARGTHGQLRVDATWSDSSTADVTTQASFSSSDLAVVTVSNAAGSEGRLTAVGMGTATVRAQLGTVTASAVITVTAATLDHLEVTPTAVNLPLGSTQRFVATGRYTDGTAQDLTTQATWTSGAPAVIAVSNAAGNEGQGTALSQGSAIVTARYGLVEGNTAVTVSAATLSRVELTPATPRLAKDTRLQLHATGVWTDNGTQELTAACTWTSASPGIATVSNATGTTGRITGVGGGRAVISATCSGVTGTVEVEVTTASLTAIELTPPSPSAAAGFSLALTATGRFSDGSTQPFTDFVAWSSADVARATVTQLGVVSARAQGPVVITAQALNVSASVTFQVTAALLQSLSLSPASASTPKGLSQAFVATGSFSDGTTVPVTELATWSSSAPAVATVSNAASSRGLATALTEGVTTVSATLSGRSATASLTVSPAMLVSLGVTPVNPTLAKGLTQQLSATGTFTDGATRDLTAQVTWSAGDGGIASVSNADGSRGLVRGLNMGSTSVTATLGGVSASTTVTVTNALLASIGVTPASPSVPRGNSQQLTATGVYTDSTTADLTAQVTWSSSDASKATISNAPGSQGRVQALAAGTTTITATLGTVSGGTTLTVTPAALTGIALTPPAPSVAAGLTLALTATGSWSDATTQDLTATASWSSSDATIASVAAGVVTARRVGTVTITASVGSVSSQLTVTVTAALLTQVQVTPQNVSRPKGLAQQFTATGVFTDNSTSDLTGTVTWASSDMAKLSISNAAGSKGLGTTLAVGAVTVTATWNGVTGSTPFNVTAAALTGLAVSPGSSTASLGSVRQYTATGTYTDGTQQPVTTQVTWSSSNAAVATVSNAAGSRGLATTLATGLTQISASLGGYGASSSLIVIQNPLSRIDLTPAAGSTALGYSRQFIAIGTYNDGTTQVLTNQVTWASSDAAVAIISNADGSRGLLSTVGVGSATITATLQGVTGTTTHGVTPAVLALLIASPSPATVAVAGSVALHVTGYFSDGSSQDLTTAVTWSSSAPGIAQVSNAAGSEGLVTGIAVGPAAITATLGSQWVTVNVTVN